MLPNTMRIVCEVCGQQATREVYDTRLVETELGQAGFLIAKPGLASVHFFCDTHQRPSRTDGESFEHAVPPFGRLIDEQYLRRFVGQQSELVL